MINKRIVRFVSEHPKYKRFPYPVIPAYDADLDTFITGQHIEPDIHDPDNGLSKDEMLGISKISEKKRNTFGYIINPTIPQYISHLVNLDLSTDDKGRFINPRHKAMFDLFILQPFVAPNKDKYISGRHFFWVEDVEREAEIAVKDTELMFNAISKVMTDTSLNKFIELALWLNFTVKGMAIEIKRVSITQLQQAIYEACKEHPENVLSFYDRTSREALFVLKLNYHGILQRRNNAFFDGEQFVGHTPADVIVWGNKKENETIYKHWGQMLADVEGKAEATLSAGKGSKSKLQTAET